MKILFATDGSESAGGAGQFLTWLPVPAGSSVRVTTVLEELDWAAPPWVKAAELEWGGKQAEEAARAVQWEGVTVSPEVRSGSVAGEILRAADEFGADLIVVGSAGRTGVAGFLLGSVARNVAKHAGQPVLVARAPRNGMQHVVVAVDESEHAAHAADFARQLPLPPQAACVITSVVRPYHPYAAMSGDFLVPLADTIQEVNAQRRTAAEALVARVAREFENAGRPATTAVGEGDPASEILDLVSKLEADLLVIGARGVSRIEGLLVGSVADRLLKTARCSVLIVH